jgi:hypothetical protein
VSIPAITVITGAAVADAQKRAADKVKFLRDRAQNLRALCQKVERCMVNPLIRTDIPVMLSNIPSVVNTLIHRSMNRL